MSQSDFGTINPDTKSGTQLATNLNDWRDALHSLHKGSTAPSYAAAGMMWLDDSAGTSWVLKLYDGTDWITQGTFDTTANDYVPAGVSSFMETLLDDADATAARTTLGLVIGTDVLSPTGDGSGLTGIATIPTGAVAQTIASTAPSGWLMLNGDTLGSAASTAAQANVIYEALFKELWNSMADAQAAVVGGRGASAQADWDADKKITLPDARGRTVIGTGTGGGLTARTHGATGGAETHVLTTSELPTSAFTGTISNIWSIQDDAVNNLQSGTDVAKVTASGSGSGSTHNNMQPWLALNYIVKF